MYKLLFVWSSILFNTAQAFALRPISQWRRAPLSTKISSKDSPSVVVSDRADVSIDDRGTPGGVQSFDFSKEDKDLATYASILTVVPIALPLLAF